MENMPASLRGMAALLLRNAAAAKSASTYNASMEKTEGSDERHAFDAHSFVSASFDHCELTI